MYSQRAWRDQEKPPGGGVREVNAVPAHYLVDRHGRYVRVPLDGTTLRRAAIELSAE